MFLMLLLCLLLFPFIHESPPPVSVTMLKLSTRRLVTYVEFPEAPSALTLACLYACFSLPSVDIMKRIIHTGDLLDEVINYQSIIVFAHTTVIIEVKHWAEVTL